MRTRTPFIEAFRKQNQDQPAAPAGVKPVKRDLTPKTMADSFHKVVRILPSSTAAIND